MTIRKCKNMDGISLNQEISLGTEVRYASGKNVTAKFRGKH